jgi:predicted phage terminase large subunit-like protein
MNQRNKLEQAYQKAQWDFTSFKRILYKRYSNPPHMSLIDRALTQCVRYIETEGKHGINRLIIEVPPRHGKTLTVSRLFPAWALGRRPDIRTMLVSYGASLAYKNSRMARNFMRSPYYQAIFPDIELASDSQSVSEWNIAGHEGGCDAMGIEGSATGKGAHILILDDLVKSRAEAESEVIREKTWDAFTGDLYNRLEPNGVIIMMFTRWHTDDPVGRALDMSYENWTRIHLPAIAEEHDPLGRDVGEALWPERYPIEVLTKIESAIGEYNFSSQYGQNPLPSKGGLFDTSKIERVTMLPKLNEFIRFYDLAATKKTKSDYTAGVKLGIDSQENIYILHVYREQKTPTEIELDILNNAISDSRQCQIRLEAEKQGIVQLDYILANPKFRGFVIDGKAPEGDKYTRATGIASRMKAGKVFMAHGEWNQAFVDELNVFPYGAHDDQVDALSGAYDALANKDYMREVPMPDWFFKTDGNWTD